MLGGSLSLSSAVLGPGEAQHPAELTWVGTEYVKAYPWFSGLALGCFCTEGCHCR